uniref:Uncharacterized protein n=1 Tax=uncultured prokaryote TaxID=198431 RepID=A0A0H5Q405_9ZZZZ|nr:hypothetical protein [uncultured prokaryote]
MADGAIYMLLDKQRYLGQELLNCYYYAQANGTGNAEEFAETFVDVVIPAMLPLQSEGLEHLAIEVINVDDPSDFFELVLSPVISGLVEDAGMPSYVAWAFKLVRASRVVRNGRKAIAGVTEAQTANNHPTGAALVLLDALADVLGAVLVGTGTDEYQPVIYGKPTPAPSSLPLRVVNVANAAFNHLSTQNTRKFFS